MLPKPAARSPGESHVFYVCRSYRLAVLIIIRPFLWQHVRLSASTATSPLQAAIYMIPGTVLPFLDVVWSFKIIKSLMPVTPATLQKVSHESEGKGHQTVGLKVTG